MATFAPNAKAGATREMADATRELMRTELAKLQAPLAKLKSLSYCLDNEPEDIAIRSTLAAMMVRASTLESQIAVRATVLNAAFDLDSILGTT